MFCLWGGLQFLAAHSFAALPPADVLAVFAFLVDQHFDNASVLEFLDEAVERAADLRKVRAGQ